MTRAVITVWPSLYEPGDGRPSSLEAFARRMRAPRAYRAKTDPPRWAAASFRGGYRSLANFVEASAIVLDLDDGSATRERIAAAFGDLHVLAHTTWTAGRWRAVVVLDRRVGEGEFSRVQRACVEVAERGGLRPELGQSAARCFALPALGGAPYEYLETGGASFDVADALRRFPVPQPLPMSAQRRAEESYDSQLARARRYLEKMPGAVSGSRGHATTFAAALRMVRGFGLQPDDALRLLLEVHNPLCSPPWSERELRHKVQQAAQRGRLPHRFLADRGRAA